MVHAHAQKYACAIETAIQSMEHRSEGELIMFFFVLSFFNVIHLH